MLHANHAILHNEMVAGKQDIELACKALQDRLQGLFGMKGGDIKKLTDLKIELEVQLHDLKKIVADWDKVAIKLGHFKGSNKALHIANGELEDEIQELQDKNKQMFHQLSKVKAKRVMAMENGNRKRARMSSTGGGEHEPAKAPGLRRVLQSLVNTNMDPSRASHLMGRLASLQAEVDQMSSENNELLLQVQLETLLCQEAEAGSKAAQSQLDSLDKGMVEEKVDSPVSDLSGLSLFSTPSSTPTSTPLPSPTPPPRSIQMPSTPPSPAHQNTTNPWEKNIFKNEYLYAYIGFIISGIATCWHYHL